MRAFVAAVPEALRSPNVGEALSGVFGSVSLTAWICLLLPQLIANYKAKSADGLSMKFLFIWLLGDVANLSGALFTSLAPSTIALACYFCVADLILIGQCTYYNTINARRRAAHLEHHQHHHHHHHHHHRRRPSASSQFDDDDNFAASTSSAAPPPPMPPPGGASETDPLLPHNDTTTTAAGVNGNGTTHHHHSHAHHKPHRQHDPLVRRRSSQIDPLTRIITGEDGTGAGAGGWGGSGSAWLYNAGSLLAVWAVGVAGWVVSYEVGALDVGGGNGGSGGSGGSGIKEGHGEDPLAVVGIALGYVSAVLYLCARIPQIIKNYREKSCEGLALLFFLLSLTGNFTYGASVISYSQEAEYFVRALPWLLGSLGTMVEDCIIFVQFRIYAPERQAAKPGGTA